MTAMRGTRDLKTRSFLICQNIKINDQHPDHSALLGSWKRNENPKTKIWSSLRSSLNLNMPEVHVCNLWQATFQNAKSRDIMQAVVPLFSLACRISMVLYLEEPEARVILEVEESWRSLLKATPACHSRSKRPIRGLMSKGTKDKGRKAQRTSGSTSKARTMENTCRITKSFKFLSKQ